MDAGYCLTKGIEKVRGEFSLAFLAYGLKRVINILGARELISCMAAAHAFYAPKGANITPVHCGVA
jgi:hypothetical protein